MNPLTEEQIETLLQRSPRPKPPGGLKEDLIQQARSARTESPAPTVARTRMQPSWLKRWWPVLVPAGFSLICAVVLAVQQVQIRNLKQGIRQLSIGLTSESSNPQKVISPGTAVEAPDQELKRLREQVSTLTAEASQLEQLRRENQGLRDHLSTTVDTIQAQDAEAMEQLKIARERAWRIACVNNMKQLGLAARLWAQDNMDRYPMNVIDMTNEMNTPKILHCPADTTRKIANAFWEYSSENCSYEFLAPGASDVETSRVLFRCPIHNNLGMCDGSVQMVSTNNIGVVQRDGKLYYEPKGN